MATQTMTCVVRHVRQVIGGIEEEQTDDVLLQRFVENQDEAAFGQLVRRHGPMVLRVCRQILNDIHAAEDAFQAAFLVLARKASSIRSRSSLAGWLYEVAYHLALRAKSNAVKRRCQEMEAHSTAGEGETGMIEDQETRAVVGEELGRLPEKYRTPLVLCYLEGKTNAQAAQELGWPSGSMSARLARAREILRDRLVGRGVALSGGGLALLLAEETAKAVPPPLVHSTVQAAVQLANEHIMTGLVSSHALTLAEGMWSTMITTKMKLVTAVVLALAMLGGGTQLLLQPSAAQESVQAAPKAAPQKSGDVYGDPLPPGAKARMGTLRWRHGGPVNFVGFTDEGKQLVTASQDGFFRVWDVATGKPIRKFAQPKSDVRTSTRIRLQGGVGMAYPLGGMAYSTCLAPDGKTLAAGTQGGAIYLYDVSTGKELRNFKGSLRGTVMALIFSPDSKSVVARGSDQIIRQYEVATGKEVRKITPNRKGGKVRINFYGGTSASMAFGSDGKVLATAAIQYKNQNRVRNGVLQLWDMTTGKLIKSIEGRQNSYPYSLAFSGDGKTLAYGATTGSVILYDYASGKELREVPAGQQGRYASALLFSPDSKTLVSRSISSRTIHLWDVATGKEAGKLGEEVPAAVNQLIRVYGGRNTGNNIAYSPDGKFLAEGLPSNTVRLWDVATGKQVEPVTGHQGGVSHIAVSPDGKTLTTRGMDNTIRQWDMTNGEQLQQFKLPAGAGNADLSADGKIVVFGANNNSIQIWDTVANKELRTIQVQGAPQQFGVMMGGAAGLSLSPDGKIVAVKNFDQSIHLYDVATGRELNPVAQAAPADPNVQQRIFVDALGGYGRSSILVFSPDGETLATVGGQSTGPRAVPLGRPVRQQVSHTIRLLNTASGKLAREFTVEKRTVIALVFSPDSRVVATVNSDQSVSLWETSSGKELHQLKTAQQGKKPLPQQKEQIKMLALRGYIANTGTFGSFSLAFSPDGRTLAISGLDQAIHLWDVWSGKELGKLEGHQGAILKLLFAPDGRTLISGSTDTTALVWDAQRFVADKLQAVEVNEQQADQLWTDLSKDDGPTIRNAVLTLSRAPEAAVSLFKKNVKPAAGVSAESIKKMIAGLESNDFTVRQKASQDLAKLGPLARPALQKVLMGQPSLETRQRIEKLIAKLDTGKALPTSQIRDLRAVWALEMAGTPEARQFLDSIAKGAPGAPLTIAAERALKRLNQ